jgi:DNA-binding transcriptional ArsR family regulator
MAPSSARMESGGKITLDQESFRALASDVRVEILKRLDARRETVTDLSNLLALSKPTLLEHLEKLRSAGLVKRIDEGRKWIYYELSRKGRKILHPERVAITLALGSAVVLAAIGAFSLFLAGNPSGQSGNPRNLTSQPIADPTRFVGADPIGLGLVLLLLSVTSVTVALVLRFHGARRRDRFFEQLRVA